MNNKQTWDTQVEVSRHNGRVVEYPALISEYRSFAKDFALKMKEEWPDCKNYVLDLACEAEGLSFKNIRAIELNPFINYGLYAMNYGAILAAHIEAESKYSAEARLRRRIN
ncbi:MAG: hypothetical protein PHX43_04485 [Alphaproteobacteria bacterium]|nr:hypothetical protein [Alphaproteobacteria bacterium]